MKCLFAVTFSYLFVVYNSFASDEIENHPNIKLLPKKCGEINEDRILSSKPNYEEFPWMALISHQQKSQDGNITFGCSGTLINSRYVLTMGHCARRATIVRVGEYDLSTTTDCHHDGVDLICSLPYQDFEIEERLVHPGNDENVYSDDIGLLRLKEPVDLNKSNVGAICLPITTDTRSRDLSKTHGIHVGWQLLRNFSSLIKSTAAVFSEEDCMKYYRAIHHKEEIQLPFNKLCVRSVSHLESGTPLIIKSDLEDYTRYVLYGLISHGYKTEPTAISTDVRKYMKWILDTIKP
ncbi:CLIP domain-containing serine protease B10-like [Battus philenor]|uniref:CLIP domain-containing serine protease B10-like n=1 Tax=Battus philenor TaxID=42288 RepID=UPI0035D1371A